MTESSTEMREQTRLRRVAEGLLAGGQAPPSRGWELGTDALALLYRLASDVSSSDDALAVLHELQVHQVELDLQLEQLEMNEEQLTEELQRYRELYEQAPVAYLRSSPDGRVLESNQVAHRMFASLEEHHAISPDGPRIVDLLRPEDRPSVNAMLQTLDADHVIGCCEVHALGATADAPALHIKARLEPGSDNMWLIVA